MGGLLETAEVVRVDVVRGDAFDAVGCALRSQVANVCSPITLVSLSGVAAGVVPGVNEVQRITVTTAATPSGTFTLTFNGQTTAPIAYNATAAAVDTALEALSSIGAGNVTTSGGALGASPVTVTFQGALAGTDVPLLVANGASLVNATVATTAITEGDPPNPAAVTGVDGNTFVVVTSLGSRPQCSTGTEEALVSDALDFETEKAAGRALWGLTGDAVGTTSLASGSVATVAAGANARASVSAALQSFWTRSTGVRTKDTVIHLGINRLLEMFGEIEGSLLKNLDVKVATSPGYPPDSIAVTGPIRIKLGPDQVLQSNDTAINDVLTEATRFGALEFDPCTAVRVA